MQIRQAQLKDAAGIAKVHVDSWRTTYKGIIPDEYLDGLSYEQREELWERNMAAPDNYIVVAENSDGHIVGFATAGKREENQTDKAADLTSIYLFADMQGYGIGKMLMKELFIYFTQNGYEKIFVEVLKDNKTRHFYEHYGAQLVKEVQIKIGGKALDELIYEWESAEKVLEKLSIS
ncbi:GNAT family N-acetyltransferase [Solibacillus ferritrahens]|uniref:GNAT family N-acetyltransferase n=1 Tax=Solibacillus ferritrahens TaxID=3098620 RepID=UPI00300B46D6